MNYITWEMGIGDLNALLSSHPCLFAYSVNCLFCGIVSL